METGQNLSISFRKHVFAWDIYCRKTLAQKFLSFFIVLNWHEVKLVLDYMQMTDT